uniref:Guanylate cyclase domain-containing protein n=1 Tax=Anisakis simplex TaxID=6269 RepID=A0A0M3JVY2_ANISI
LNSLTARWVNPPYRFYTQYWIYNYTNPLEIMNRGAAPDMFEKGPYSYRVSLVNYIEKFSDDGAEVLYRPQSVYHFDKATSCAGCTPSDIFLVPDTVFFVSSYQDFVAVLISMLIIFQLLNKNSKMIRYQELKFNMIYTNESLMAFQKTVNSLTSVEGLKAVLCAKLGDLLCSSANPDALNALTQGIIDNYTEYASIAIKALNAGPLVYTTVDDLLFKGYDDPLFTKVAQFAVDAIQTMSPPLAQMVPENISTPKIHLNNNNDTINPMYTMSTGKKRNKQIGEILSIDVYPNSTDNSNGSSLSTTWSVTFHLHFIRFFHPSVLSPLIFYIFMHKHCLFDRGCSDCL